MILVVGGGIGALQFLGSWFIDESPKWLAINGKTAQAKQIMGRIRGRTDFEDDVEDLGTAREGQGTANSDAITNSADLLQRNTSPCLG